MTSEEIEKLKYPIGKFDCPLEVSPQKIMDCISILEHFPDRLKNLVEKFNDARLDTAYRPGGWTVRQVIHHLSDSHLNAYIRFKWTLTEETPAIKAYYEDKWAKLPDYTAPIDISLNMLDALHKKWTLLLKSLDFQSLNKIYIHPESGENILKNVVGMYAWHSNHHFAHIQNLAKREGWV
ncbi:YfiT family bacillithiol transferase [Abyssalbus ytuae]|uniref:Bacillithiol transferase BstA n=1 Tax=Abyssalbus ytuae TaxID=2926907 RepID=A0A9E6ZQI8_9FLAO|nr:bacillithiol transferase BstA [Abyssalbus ytuae]UOB16938.1 bacillithiol transferase BstA [Abyssalbus ytuae]